MSGITRRKLCWRWEDGTETVDIMDGPDGWRVTGRHGDALFWLDCRPDFKTRSINIINPEHRITLVKESAGWRTGEGSLVPDSAGALDVDFAATAFTNTLPIRRLALEDGASAEIDVLYIPLPDLTPRVVRQGYRREGQIWHYHNRDSGFRAALTVDKDGFVTDYPGVCHQTESS